jgi:uncharacterized protein
MTVIEVLDDPCRDCGACCLQMARPPFCGPSDPEWTRLESARPDLAREIEADRAARPLTIANEAEGWPCLWLDPVARRCRHYEYRPEVCRDFEPGEDDCLRHRERRGIATPIATEPHR